MSGDVCIKLAHAAPAHKPRHEYAAYSLKNYRFVHPLQCDEVVPVYAELILRENCWEDYEPDGRDYDDDGPDES